MPRRSTKSTADSTASTAKQPQKERVRFVFEPDRNSPNGITFSWLLHKAYAGKEKAGTATRSFWLPFACRESGKYSESDLRELAQQCVWRMEEQIQHIRESFDLDSPPRQATPAPAVTQPAISPAPALPEPEEPQTRFFGNLDLSIEEDMLGELGDALG